MTKTHGKFVNAVGNGNRLTVTILRLFGGGAVVAGIGALVWIGTTVERSAQTDAQLGQRIDGFIQEQRAINQQLYERLNRHEGRIEYLERNAWGGPQ